MKLVTEHKLIMAIYLVEKYGLEEVARGLLCSDKALKSFLDTGTTKNAYINAEIPGYFFGVFKDEMARKSGVKNYDEEGLTDLKAGNRKGGAGGGSNNSFGATVSDTYL